MIFQRRSTDHASWRAYRRRENRLLVAVAVVAFTVAYCASPSWGGGEPPVPVRLWLKMPDVAGDCYGVDFPVTPGQAHLKEDGTIPLTAARFSAGQMLPLAGVRMGGGWQLIPDGEREEIERRARRGEVEILVEAVGVCAEKGKRKKLFNLWWWRRVKS